MSDRCYVFIQLPRATQVVPCGRLRVEEQQGLTEGRFAYLPEYLARTDAVAIDPFELPLQKGTFTSTRLRGLFGAIRDASPDAWGRRVIEHALKVTELSEVQYLLNSPEDRAGALSFSRDEVPPAPVQRFNRTLQLAELLHVAELILDGLPVETVQQAHDALSPGTSLGGARPKAVIEDEAGLWIAKFPLRSDRWNVPVVEGAMLSLASRAGLRVAEHRIVQAGDRAVLLVKRFDRERITEGWLRSRMVSALTVLRADEAVAHHLVGQGTLADEVVSDRLRWSYPALADELRRWSDDGERDRRELFGRIAFNALISNADDHPRNHALIAPGAKWRLSPAYDLTPTPSSSQERRLAMTIGLHGVAATRVNLLSAAGRFALSEEAANAEIDRIKTVIATHWESEVRAAGGSEADVRAVAPAFDYPGFEY